MGVQPGVKTLDILETTERVVGAPGAFFAVLPHLEFERQFRQQIHAAGAVLDFGELLRKLREQKRWSVPKLVRLAGGDKKWHHLIYGWEAERGRKPSLRHQKIVGKLDRALTAEGALLRKYHQAPIEDPGDIGPRIRKFQDEPYALWTDLLELGFQHMEWFKKKDAHTEGIDRTKRWSDIAADIQKKELSYYFGWLVHHSGLGFTAETVTLPLVTRADLIQKFVDWRRERAGAYNYWTVNFISTIMGHLRPETGYFWQFPLTLIIRPEFNPRNPNGLADGWVAMADICSDGPHAADYCPQVHAFLPTGERVRRGRRETHPLTNPYDRCVVHCEVQHRNLKTRLRQIGQLPPSQLGETRSSVRRAEKILEMENPLLVNILCSDRMAAARPPRRQEIRWAIHVRNELIVALLGIYPFRPRTVVRLIRNKHVQPGTGSDWFFAIEPELFKNWAFGAEYGFFGRMHKDVAKLLKLWVEEARPILMKKASSPVEHLLLTAPDFGRPIRELRHIDHICIAETRKFIPEFSPNGLNPSSFRKIVATHFRNKEAPWEQQHAEVALKDKRKTVSKHYAAAND